MNRKTNWIEALEKELQRLPEEDRKDILHNYQEQISVMLTEGKNEEEILERLGSPKDVAKEALQALGMEMDSELNQDALFENIKQGVNETFNSFTDAMQTQGSDGKSMGEKIIYIALLVVFCFIGFGFGSAALGLMIGGIVVFFVSFLVIPITWSLFFLLVSVAVLIFNSGLAIFYGLYRLGRYLITQLG